MQALTTLALARSAPAIFLYFRHSWCRLPEANMIDRVPTSPDPSRDILPDPFGDADALEDLGDRIATLAAHIHAATQRLLELIADFDARHGWELGGYRGCAEWLAARTGMDLGAARERVRTARILVALPKTSAAMGRGELSFSQVRALTRVATPENEGELLEVARGTTTAVLERVVRAWKRGSAEDEAAWELEQYESRNFSVFPDEEGMYLVRGRLTAEVASVLMRAVEAASDALYRDVRGRTPTDSPEFDRARAAARRRADAVGLLSERALAAGFGRVAEGEAEGDPPISGSRAERYQVFLHVDAERLKEPAPGELAGLPHSGRSELEDGTRVSAETSRRLCCDTSLVRITYAAPGSDGGGSGGSGAPDPDASILSVGRRTRTIPPALRRALEIRDRGCRFPGCGLRFTDAHHLRHWADGGDTSLSNCVLLCRFHHRLVHEGGWRVQWRGGARGPEALDRQGPLRPTFIDPRGGVHFEGRARERDVGRASEGELRGPRRDQLPEAPDAPLVRENLARGIRPDEWTAAAQWEHESDIPWPLLARGFGAAYRGPGLRNARCSAL